MKDTKEMEAIKLTGKKDPFIEENDKLQSINE